MIFHHFSPVFYHVELLHVQRKSSSRPCAPACASRTRPSCASWTRSTRRPLGGDFKGRRWWGMVSWTTQKCWKLNTRNIKQSWIVGWAVTLPSGKRLHNYGKSLFLMGKSTISMTIFNSKLLVYQVGYPPVSWNLACDDFRDRKLHG